MIIQHNIMALNAYRQLNGNNAALASNLEKLSSGFRINRAADDAAGLAISEKMRAQIKGLETAQKNAQDGISLIQTAEGALTEVHSMLNRMVELAGMASNGIYDDQVDRKALDDEFQQLKAEIDRISKSTNFNGKNLLDGTLSAGGAAAGLSGKGITISSDLAGILKAGEGAPIAATRAEYKIDKANIADFLTKGLGIASAKQTSAGEILSKMGLDASEYEVLTQTDYNTDKVDGKIETAAATENVFFTGADATAGDQIIIRAKTAGVDPNAQKIISTGLGIAGGNGSGFYESRTGAAAYKEATLSIDNDLINDGSLIGKTFSINGKTYEFTGQNQTNENGVEIKSSGEKLANGNYSINIASPAGTPDGDGYTAGEVATEVALAVNMVEYNIKSNTNPNGVPATAIPTYAAATAASPVKSPLAVAGQNGIRTDNGTAKSNVITFDVANPMWGGKNSGSAGTDGGLRLQIGDSGDEYNIISVGVEDMSTKGLGIANLNIATYEAAKAALGTIEQQGDPGTIKGAINVVSTQRAALGALQNRLEHTINNLGVTTENVTAAESRIRDTDMAKEMMEYTKNNILVQAAQAMLSQANMVPQGVLQLLG